MRTDTFIFTFSTKPKKTLNLGKNRIFWVIMSVGNENTLSLKDVSNELNEHQSPIIFEIVSVGLDELTDCATHQIRVVKLIFVTQDGHLFLENIGWSQTGLVWVFLHSGFLSIFYFLHERFLIQIPSIRVRSSGRVTFNFLTSLSASIIYLSLVALTDWWKVLESLSTRRGSICFYWVHLSFWCFSLRCATSREKI
jgi:hypothetical protein